MCARLEIRTGRLAHTRRAHAVRAKCSLAGLTIERYRTNGGLVMCAKGLLGFTAVGVPSNRAQLPTRVPPPTTV